MKIQAHLCAAACAVASFALAPSAQASNHTPFEGPAVIDLPIQDTLALQGPPPQTGQVLITEFMKDPTTVADNKGEWFEVYNNMPWRVNLEGWTISDDGGSSHVINVGGAGMKFAPGRYFVLGNNADVTTNGGVHIDYQYSGFVLANGSDQIMLTRPNGTLSDRVAYDATSPWPTTAGRSISLKATARDCILNDDGANWCHSSVALNGSNTDTGTPGQDNDPCI